MKPILYISGPFSHEDLLHGVEENIITASRYSLEAWRGGWAVICPHKNTSGFQHCEITWDIWLDGDISFIDRLTPNKGDALLMLRGWEKSKGACAEREFAIKKGLSIYYAIDGIPNLQSF